MRNFGRGSAGRHCEKPPTTRIPNYLSKRTKKKAAKTQHKPRKLFLTQTERSSYTFLFDWNVNFNAVGWDSLCQTAAKSIIWVTQFLDQLQIFR